MYQVYNFGNCLLMVLMVIQLYMRLHSVAFCMLGWQKILFSRSRCFPVCSVIFQSSISIVPGSPVRKNILSAPLPSRSGAETGACQAGGHSRQDPIPTRTRVQLTVGKNYYTRDTAAPAPADRLCHGRETTRRTTSCDAGKASLVIQRDQPRLGGLLDARRR